MASADFSIDSTPVPAAVSVAYGATVNLAVLNLTGVKTITWRIAGSSNPSLSNPTITPAGSPSGATATFSQVSDPGTGLGASFLIECTVTDSTGATDVAYGVAGTVNASGYIPLASGEQLARHATHGWTAAVNQAMHGPPRAGLGKPFMAAACATSNKTLSGDPSPVDGVTLSTGDIILLTAQTSTDENGPWTVSTTGSWLRPYGFRTGEQAQGTMVQVLAGTVYEETLWMTRSDAVIDTDAIVFERLSPVIIAKGTKAIDFGSVASDTTSTYEASITGHIADMVSTDMVLFAISSDTAITFRAHVTATNKITWRAINSTSGAIDPPSISFYYMVLR